MNGISHLYLKINFLFFVQHKPPHCHRKQGLNAYIVATEDFFFKGLNRPVEIFKEKGLK